ncbi:hypothetical protein PGT21_005857 [Puccinia graminis f. sp. tritici]|uniref:Uncharacterized protein n=1 Tax=Puccinia graminis f. sp. tritici TaxID=56615 RepID=A0A5B0LKT4_PUCGR|nr:hypothetical protein PGT21_005857 [Puccinia graminis f. sp. tritici]
MQPLGCAHVHKGHDELGVTTLLSQPTPLGSDLVPSSCGHASKKPPIRPAPPIEHHAPNLLFKVCNGNGRREIKQGPMRVVTHKQAQFASGGHF